MEQSNLTNIHALQGHTQSPLISQNLKSAAYVQLDVPVAGQQDTTQVNHNSVLKGIIVLLVHHHHSVFHALQAPSPTALI